MSGALNREGVSQLFYTTTANRPPPDHTLLIGELAIELADPIRLWVGVPSWMSADGKRLVYDKSSGTEEAPTDGQIYGRRGSNLSWQPVLPLTGGALTGPLQLPIAAPTLPEHAANKAYVDSQFASALVWVSDTPPTTPRDGQLWWDSAGTQLYLRYRDPTNTSWVVAVNQSGILTSPPLDGQTYGRKSAEWEPVLPLAGGTMSGALMLYGPPTAANEAVTKAYVDGRAGSSIPITFPFVGKPSANVAIYIPVAMDMNVPAGLTGTVVYDDVQATANATFTLSRIRTGASTLTLGVVTITPATRTSCLLSGSGGVLQVGDTLALTGPGTQDATLANLGITLLASRA